MKRRMMIPLRLRRRFSQNHHPVVRLRAEVQGGPPAPAVEVAVQVATATSRSRLHHHLSLPIPAPVRLAPQGLAVPPPREQKIHRMLLLRRQEWLRGGVSPHGPLLVTILEGTPTGASSFATR
jgi:hypothetical protein